MYNDYICISWYFSKCTSKKQTDQTVLDMRMRAQLRTFCITWNSEMQAQESHPQYAILFPPPSSWRSNAGRKSLQWDVCKIIIMAQPTFSLLIPWWVSEFEIVIEVELCWSGAFSKPDVCPEIEGPDRLVLPPLCTKLWWIIHFWLF